MFTTYFNSNFRGTLSAYAYSLEDHSCPSDIGMKRSWNFAMSGGVFGDAGDGLEVICATDSGTIQTQQFERSLFTRANRNS